MAQIEAQDNSNLDTSRRFSARYLLLQYNDVSSSFDPSEIRRLVTRVKAQCLITRKRKRNMTQCMAFISFNGKRFQTRNLSMFDVQGQSPVWHHIRSAPWKWYDDCLSHGEILFNEAPRPRRMSKQILESSYEQKEIPTAMDQSLLQPLASSNDKDEFLEICMSKLPAEAQQQLDFLTTSLDELASTQHQRSHGSKRLPLPSPLPSPTPLPQSITEPMFEPEESDRRLSTWSEGFKAGFEAGLNRSTRFAATPQISEPAFSDDRATTFTDPSSLTTNTWSSVPNASPSASIKCHHHRGLPNQALYNSHGHLTPGVDWDLSNLFSPESAGSCYSSVSANGIDSYFGI